MWLEYNITIQTVGNSISYNIFCVPTLIDNYQLVVLNRPIRTKDLGLRIYGNYTQSVNVKFLL